MESYTFAGTSARRYRIVDAEERSCWIFLNILDNNHLLQIVAVKSDTNEIINLDENTDELYADFIKLENVTTCLEEILSQKQSSYLAFTCKQARIQEDEPIFTSLGNTTLMININNSPFEVSCSELQQLHTVKAAIFTQKGCEISTDKQLIFKKNRKISNFKNYYGRHLKSEGWTA
jgi:hypothetical protein